MAKNCLTQQNVKRQAVLLLGFGLKMSADDVNEFLYKALQEPLLNDQNPFEAICKYCYQHGFGYYKFQQLWKSYKETEPDRMDKKPLCGTRPAGLEGSYAAVQDDAELLCRLTGLKKRNGAVYADVLYDRFRTLYDQARDLIAAQSSVTEGDEALLKARRLRGELSHSDRLYDCEKEERVRRIRETNMILSREDIQESDLEHILCSAIPMDLNGNLISAKRSALHALFEGKRFSRQRISNILLRKTEPERYDLITLVFLIFSLRVDDEPNAQKRYMRFIESANRTLSDCFMGPLYVTNPYECFVLMCMLSVSPLETYNDVIEKSYQASRDGGERMMPEK